MPLLSSVKMCLCVNDQCLAVKLQPPSGAELPAFNPILPPAAVTQILLIANPNKVVYDLQLSRYERTLQLFSLRLNVYPPLCFSGEGSAAVQTNLQHGRAGAQRERQRRTVSSPGEVGGPIAYKPNLTDFLLFRLLSPPEHSYSFRFPLQSRRTSDGLRLFSGASPHPQLVCFALN